MSFSISPGVVTREIDLSTTVPSVATTAGAFSGVFQWGPIDELTLVTSENDLVAKFGKPKSTFNIETWFSAANFLQYSNQLFVVRAGNTSVSDSNLGAHNALAHSEGAGTPYLYSVRNRDHYDNVTFTNDANVYYVAKWAGELGNSLKVSVCDSAEQYRANLNIVTEVSGAFGGAGTKFTISVGANTGTLTLVGANNQADSTTAANSLKAKFILGDYIEVGNSSIGKQQLKISGISGVTTSGSNSENASVVFNFSDVYKLSVAYDTAQNANTITRLWEYYNTVDSAPGQSPYVATSGNTAAADEMHVVVVDEDGKFTGTPGTVLEAFQNLSRASDARGVDGGSIFYQNIINESSAYIWWANDRSGAPSNTAVNIASSTAAVPLSLSFQGGNDGPAETSANSDIENACFSNIVRGYDLFAVTENVDIGLVISGKARGANGVQLANYIIDNVVEVRKDCVAFISPERSDVVNSYGSEAQNVVDFRNNVRSTSYAVMDSGYKYAYDKYNDQFMYVPLNADIAGLCARTDTDRDPWFSPAGFNRGSIRNTVKLAWNPNQAERDLLYKAGVNPVVSFPGQGPVLYGDKTLLNRTSAFDRINVRRLFIILEKSISIAAQSAMFEFNDEFTRAQFRNLVEPFLRDVQGRRGITDFRVVCDESNNTPEVIDNNRFVGDIYIRPNRSINFIRLSFIAVRTGVEFTEISG